MERPQRLESRHRVENFDCGEAALNTYLHKHALQSQLSNGTVTYVAVVDSNIVSTVVGYYTLRYGSIDREEAPARIGKGLGTYASIPIIILARLAIDYSMQRKGLGKGLLKDALYRAVSASQLAGLQAFVVHAKNDAARLFSERYDFEPLPENSLHLYRLISDIKRELR